MGLDVQMRELATGVREAGRKLACASGIDKNRALSVLAGLLDSEREAIFAANAKDIEAAKAAGMDSAKLDRLTITDGVVDSMIQACHEVEALSDPVGEIESMIKRPNGLLVGHMRIPLGVIFMIYESRPNVTIDAAILCLKAGNGVILRGGSEAVHSNTCLAGLLSQALEEAGIPGDSVRLVPTQEREAVSELLKLEDLIDVVIPRGGEGLIRAVVAQATMPVLKHYKGVCHAYVDKHVDLEEAVEIVFNGKCHRPGVCNALECLLVHEQVADAFLPMVMNKLGHEGEVEFHACERSFPKLGPTAVKAQDSDWGHEFHELKMAVKVVDSMGEAMEHIAQYGSNHTEIILTTDYNRSMKFLREVDASLVVANASSRFNDGGELGLGAEIGISTSKLHSYGPMGVKELTSSKFVCFGEGQVRS